MNPDRIEDVTVKAKKDMRFKSHVRTEKDLEIKNGRKYHAYTVPRYGTVVVIVDGESVALHQKDFEVIR